MSNVLQKYLPEHDVQSCFELIKASHVHLKIVNERVTRHGDYRKDVQGFHLITVNANLNKYRFLMTLIHEIAHLVAFEKYGRFIKPHGNEWKLTFQKQEINSNLEKKKINYFNSKIENIRVIKGTNFDYFSDNGKKTFLEKEYTVSKLSDRMGMRLEGTKIENIVNTFFEEFKKMNKCL